MIDHFEAFHVEQGEHLAFQGKVFEELPKTVVIVSLPSDTNRALAGFCLFGRLDAEYFMLFISHTRSGRPTIEN